MKIVIDARMLGWSGIGRYTAELLKYLQAVDHDNTYLVLLNNRAFGGWQPTNKNFSKIRANYRPYSLGEQLRLPRLLKSLKPDVVHFLSFNSPLVYGGTRITTIHDLTPLNFWPGRGLLSRAKYWPLRLVLRRAIKGSQLLLTPSEFVKGQIAKRYRVKPAKIVITPEAAELSAAEAKPIAELKGQDFLLYVGNAYPHKNLGILVEGFKQLHHQFPDLQLVLCGRRDSFYEQLQAVSPTVGIHFINGANDQQLRWLYGHAKLFVFPSLSEGFGLPGLEAMSQGLAVVAARATSLPEVYGQAAEYFDPRDASDLAKIATKLLKNDELRKQLAYRGQQRAQEFSWHQTATTTLAAYQRLQD